MVKIYVLIVLVLTLVACGGGSTPSNNTWDNARWDQANWQ